MKALVTGATGFIGSNLARELVADGAQLRALARKGSDRKAIEGVNVDIVEGDLLDADSLRKAAEGCDAEQATARPIQFRTGTNGTRCVRRIPSQGSNSETAHELVREPAAFWPNWSCSVGFAACSLPACKGDG